MTEADEVVVYDVDKMDSIDIIPEQPQNPYVQALNFIHSNLEAAQAKTGAFTMVDCKNVRNAYFYLVEFMSSLTENSIAGEMPFGAMGMIYRASDLQQSKGIFTMAGSVEILNKLEFIHTKLMEIKDPSLKLQETKEEIKKKNGRGKKKH